LFVTNLLFYHFHWWC